MGRIPDLKLVGESWAWAMFQAGEAWIAWEITDELEALGHPHLASVYRSYARQLAQNALPFLEELACHHVARDIHRRVSSILNLNPSKEEVHNVP